MRARRHKLIAASYLFLKREDQVLLSRRANTGYQDGKYGLVAGHLEGDETATEAMIREAKEEIGITLAASDLRMVHLAHRLGRDGGDERLDIFFQAEHWEGLITNCEPDKCDDLDWFALDDLPAELIVFTRKVLEDILAGKIYSEYLEEPS